jgi:hypothetical protein
MRKVPIIVGVPDGYSKDIVKENASVILADPGEIPGVNYPTITFNYLGKSARFLIHSLKRGISAAVASVAPSGEWEAWLMIPEEGDWRYGPALFRLLKKLSLSAWSTVSVEVSPGVFENRKRIVGPWTLMDFSRSFPAALVNQTIRLQLDDGMGGITYGVVYCPHVFAGDPDPVLLATTEYDPSDSDCENDIEPNAEDLFGVEPA